MTIRQGLEHLKRNPPSYALRQKISQWLEYLERGLTVTDSVRALGSWTSDFDLALIEAGEKSGRLDAAFKMLALHYEEQARLIKQIISDLLYPLFVFHFAIVLFPFISFLQTGNVFKFVTSVLLVLGPLYVAVYCLILACQGRHGEAWRARLEDILRIVPVLGTARKDLAIARLSSALEALLNAGVPIVGAWELAATASGSPALKRIVQTWRPRIDNGFTPAGLISESPEFPTVFHNLYHTGEISGQLDQVLKRLHEMYLEEGTRRMRLVSRWGPQILYFGVAIYVGFKVISYYIGYFNMIDQISK